MPITSQAFRSATFQPETGQAFLALVTIAHSDLAAPMRLSTDSVDTVSRGLTFVAYPLEITLPPQEAGTLPVARIRIDNVDREISTAVQQITPPLTVTIEMVLSGNPDEVIMAYTDFLLKGITYDALTVEGDLMVRDWGKEPFPAWSFGPGRFASLFRAT